MSLEMILVISSVQKAKLWRYLSALTGGELVYKKGPCLSKKGWTLSGVR